MSSCYAQFHQNDNGTRFAEYIRLLLVEDEEPVCWDYKRNGSYKI